MKKILFCGAVLIGLTTVAVPVFAEPTELKAYELDWITAGESQPPPNGGAIVGRFPWNDPNMDFYDIRDASGERLWYVVSSNFANSKPAGTDVINSDTAGTITLIDPSGQVTHYRQE